jgi:hypothetical protein
MSPIEPDEHLRQALRHAPDAELAAPAFLSAQIVAAAHRSAAEQVRAGASRRWNLGSWGRPHWGASGALVTVVMAGFIGLLWRDEAPGPAREAPEAVVAQAPSATTADAVPARTTATAPSDASADAVRLDPTVDARRAAAKEAAAPAPLRADGPLRAAKTRPAAEPAAPSAISTQERDAAPEQRARQSVSTPPRAFANTGPAVGPEKLQEQAGASGRVTELKAQTPADANGGARTPSAPSRVSAPEASQEGPPASPAPTPAAAPAQRPAPPQAAAAPPAVALSRNQAVAGRRLAGAGSSLAVAQPLWSDFREGDELQWQPPAAWRQPDGAWFMRLMEVTRGRWQPAQDARPEAGSMPLQWLRGGVVQGRLWLEPAGVLRCGPVSPCERAQLEAEQVKGLLAGLAR